MWWHVSVRWWRSSASLARVNRTSGGSVEPHGAPALGRSSRASRAVALARGRARAGRRPATAAGTGGPTVDTTVPSAVWRKPARRLGWRTSSASAAARSAAASSRADQLDGVLHRVGVGAAAVERGEEVQAVLQRRRAAARPRGRGRPRPGRRAPRAASGHQRAVRRHGGAVDLVDRAGDRGQPGHRPLGEHVPGRQDQAVGPGPAHELDGGDAVAAEDEEVVLDAHRGQARARRPSGAARAGLPPGPRRHAGRQRGQVGGGQRRPVELAAGLRGAGRRRRRRRPGPCGRAAPARRGPAPRRGRAARGRPSPPDRARRSRPAASRPGRSSRSTTAARSTPGWRASAASTSAGSMRKPRSFTCSSARPRKSRSPSGRQATRSPVRYMRAPGSGVYGSATNRSAVRSGRPR